MTQPIEPSMSKLDEILTRYKQGNYLEFPKDIRYARTKDETVQAILQWVKDEFFGQAFTLDDIYGTDWKNNYGFSEQQVRDAANFIQRRGIRKLKEIGLEE